MAVRHRRCFSVPSLLLAALGALHCLHFAGALLPLTPVVRAATASAGHHSSRYCRGVLTMRAQSRAGKHGPPMQNVGRAQRTLKRVDQLPDANKVMVSNLDFSVSETELREVCEQFGDVVEVKIIKNRWTGRSRGFGFVVFALPLQATVAIEDMTGHEFKGRPVVVKNAFKAGSCAAAAMEGEEGEKGDSQGGDSQPAEAEVEQ